MAEAALQLGAERYTVPGLERGLRLLAEFSRHEPVLAAPELARRLDVPRSTVFRLLVTLEGLGFVQRTADGGAYRLGLSVLRLGFEYLASLSMIELGRPLLERLRDATGNAASLVVRDGRDIVYIHRAAVSTPFASSVTVGTRLPAHATVLGHVLLSDKTLAQLRKLYPERKLERRSASTPADAEALFKLTQLAQRRGHVLAEGFFEQHISTVAAPVFDDSAQVVAAVGLTIAGSKINADKRAEYTAQVRAAAEQLSNLLNHAAQPNPARRTRLDQKA